MRLRRLNSKETHIAGIMSICLSNPFGYRYKIIPRNCTRIHVIACQLMKVMEAETIAGDSKSDWLSMWYYERIKLYVI